MRASAWKTLILGCSQTTELEAQLRDRLPRSYDIYLEIISEMESAMESLKKELGIEQLQLAVAKVSLNDISTQDSLPVIQWLCIPSSSRDLRGSLLDRFWVGRCPAPIAVFLPTV